MKGLGEEEEVEVEEEEEEEEEKERGRERGGKKSPLVACWLACLPSTIHNIHGERRRRVE